MNKPDRPLVYTAVFGGYDSVQAVETDWNCEFLCYSDDPEIDAPGWQVKLVDCQGRSPRDMNRMYKILGHRFHPEYRSSLYIDGNVSLKADPSPLFRKYSSAPFYGLVHTERSGVYSEAEELLLGARISPAEKQQLREQINRYRLEGFPDESGLSENCVLLRWHGTELEQLMDAWWQEWQQGCPRDQIGLPFVSWRLGLPLAFLEEHPKRKQPWFAMHLHRPDENTNPLKLRIRKARMEKYRSPVNWLVGTASQLTTALVLRWRRRASRDKDQA